MTRNVDLVLAVEFRAVQNIALRVSNGEDGVDERMVRDDGGKRGYVDEVGRVGDCAAARGKEGSGEGGCKVLWISGRGLREGGNGRWEEHCAPREV